MAPENGFGAINGQNVTGTEKNGFGIEMFEPLGVSQSPQGKQMWDAAQKNSQKSSSRSLPTQGCRLSTRRFRFFGTSSKRGENGRFKTKDAAVVLEDEHRTSNIERRMKKLGKRRLRCQTLNDSFPIAQPPQGPRQGAQRNLRWLKYFRDLFAGRLFCTYRVSAA